MSSRSARSLRSIERGSQTYGHLRRSTFSVDIVVSQFVSQSVSQSSVIVANDLKVRLFCRIVSARILLCEQSPLPRRGHFPNFVRMPPASPLLLYLLEATILSEDWRKTLVCGLLVSFCSTKSDGRDVYGIYLLQQQQHHYTPHGWYSPYVWPCSITCSSSQDIIIL